MHTVHPLSSPIFSDLLNALIPTGKYAKEYLVWLCVTVERKLAEFISSSLVDRSVIELRVE